MTRRNQIEEEKALILNNLGIYVKKESLYKRLGMTRATFFRRLREIQDEHAELLPDDLCATTTIEIYNQFKKRTDNYWEHYMSAELEYSELLGKSPGDDIDEKLAYQRALDYLETKVCHWGEQYENAGKAFIYFMKSVGKYQQDVNIQSVDQNLTVVFQGMHPDSGKRTKEVNEKPKGKG